MGVTKCYVSPYFNFDRDEPNGDIYVNVDNNDLCMDVYKLFTVDPDVVISDDQSLWIDFDDFESRESNFEIDV